VPENLIDAHERIIDTESFHADHPVDGTQAVETVCSVEPGIALGVTRESVSLGCPPPESITDSTPIDTAKISMKVSKSPSATRRSAEQRLVDDLSFKTSIDISPSESVKLRKRGNKTHSLPTSKEVSVVLVFIPVNYSKPLTQNICALKMKILYVILL